MPFCGILAFEGILLVYVLRSDARLTLYTMILEMFVFDPKSNLSIVMMLVMKMICLKTDSWVELAGLCLLGKLNENVLCCSDLLEADNLLSCLYPGDDGLQSPNPANSYMAL